MQLQCCDEGNGRFYKLLEKNGQTVKDKAGDLKLDIDDLSGMTNLRLKDLNLLDDYTQLDDGVMLSTKLTAELLSRLPKDETVEYEDGMQLQCCDEGEGTFYQLAGCKW